MCGFAGVIARWTFGNSWGARTAQATVVQSAGVIIVTLAAVRARGDHTIACVLVAISDLAWASLFSTGGHPSDAGPFTAYIVGGAGGAILARSAVVTGDRYAVT